MADLESCDDLYTLTPTKFNPHSRAYARNEANMVDWEGNLIERCYRDPILLDDVPDDFAMASALQIGAAEAAAVDDLLSSSLPDSCDELDIHQVPRAADEVIGGLLGMSPLLSEEYLSVNLAKRGQLGRDQICAWCNHS